MRNYLPKKKHGFTGFSLPPRSLHAHGLHERGFTLIELLVSVAIIGLLASVSLASFSNAQMKTRDAKRKDDLKKISAALYLYYQDNNKLYPFPAGGTDMVSNNPANNPWITGLNAQYIINLPHDSLEKSTDNSCTASATNHVYCYRVDNTHTAFILWAQLENPNDQELYSSSTYTKAVCNPTSISYMGFQNVSLRNAPNSAYNYCVLSPT